MDQEFLKLKDIIADVLNVDPDEIKMETTFAEDLGADSLDLYQIVMGIEEAYSVTVDEEQAAAVKTVGEALQLIKQATGGSAN